MNWDVVSVYVTAHAVGRYRSRVGPAGGAAAVAAALRGAGRAGNRLRKRLAAGAAPDQVWVAGPAVFVVRWVGARACVVVTVLAAAWAGRPVRRAQWKARRAS